MTTKITVENHSRVRLEVTFENKINDEEGWVRFKSTIFEKDDVQPRDFYIWGKQRLIVEEL
jgi:type IV secretory pathway component VirB8